jgi:hypothetical protein
MTDLILLFIAILILAVSFMGKKVFYRVSGFMVAFSLLSMAVTKDLASIFIMIINALVIGVLLLLSHKEYSKND